MLAASYSIIALHKNNISISPINIKAIFTAGHGSAKWFWCKFPKRLNDRRCDAFLFMLPTRLGQLAGAVASLPSGEVVAPVFHALASGLMDVFVVVRTIRILVRHGVPLSDKDVVAQLEAVYAQTADAK